MTASGTLRAQRLAGVVGATALAFALVGLAGLGGCSSSSTSPAGPGPANTSIEAPAAWSALDPEVFAASLSRPGTVLLDVRTPAEFAAGHLPGAMLVDIEAAGFEAKLAALDKGATYAVYCRTGNRSGAALAAMRQLGFTSAYHLAGGITAWQQTGRRVVT